jgi:pyridoxamine 5'-phosphate oxidase
LRHKKLSKHYIFNEINSNSILSERTVKKNPFLQFKKWLEEITEAEITWPEAMSLATVDPEGMPSIRTILLKELDEHGFVFFTNYNSRKANDLLQNPKGSILFYWKELERQVRIEGVIEKISIEKSEEYFHTRPRDSQIAAWVSKQSEKIPDRDHLDKKFNEYTAKFGNREIPLPQFWGGYRLIPNYFEFWQGMENRLHDRICYRKKDKNWDIFRLAP